MQAELKRKEIETAAATELQKQQIEANLKRQAIEKREIEKKLHTRMELEKQLAAEKQEILRLKYEAKARSLEQQLKDKSQLLSTTQESVQTRVATPSCDIMESSSCAHPVLTPSLSPGYTQSLLQGPPPLFASSLLSGYMSQAPPTLALSTMVQPTPAPVPSAFGTQPASGYGAPQVTQSIVATAAQSTLSAAAIATCNAIASSSGCSAAAPTVSAPGPSSNVALEATNPSVTVSMPPATTMTAAASTQSRPADATAQTNAGPASIQPTSAPVVIVR